MLAVGYARVSTDEQSISLEDQIARLSTLAASMPDVALVAIETDPGLSADSLDRPGLQRALARLDVAEAELLIVLKLDRLTRRVADWQRLLDHHFGPRADFRHRLISAGETLDLRTAAGRLTANLLVSVSEWELDTIRDRTRSALAHKRSHDELLGTVPYGRRRDPLGRVNRAGSAIELEADPAEALTLTRIVELRRAGLSLRKIARALEAEGHRPRNGATWSTSTLKRLLDRSNPAHAAPG